MSAAKSLLQQIANAQTVKRAWKVVRKNRKVAPGIDEVTIRMFEASKRTELATIVRQLRDQTFEFQAARRAHIPKGESDTRPINVLSIRDKVVQQVIQTLFLPKRDTSKTLFPEIYNDVAIAYLPNTNGLAKSVEQIKAAYNSGHKYLTTMDIKNFFDEIPADRMYQRILDNLHPDESIDWLIKKTVDQEVYKNGAPDLNPGGVLQGSIIAPLYSNIYLADFDKALMDAELITIRYADDLAILTRTHSSAKKAVEIVRKALHETAGMEFYPDGHKKGPVIRLLDDYGVFLGIRYSLNPNKRLSIEPAYEKIRSQKRRIDEFFMDEDLSIAEAIIKTNQSIHSWFHHYVTCGCHMGPLKKAIGEVHKHYRRTVKYSLKQIGLFTNPQVTNEQLYHLGILRQSSLKRRKEKRRNKQS